MSISELNQFMTYVLDGWLLFSASSVGIGLVSFVSRRIQEDIAAENLAIAQAAESTTNVAETVTEVAESAVVQTIPSTSKAPSAQAPLDDSEADETEATEEAVEAETDEAIAEAARLEEVAAVSEQLAKNKGKQSDTSSVSVST